MLSGTAWGAQAPENTVSWICREHDALSSSLFLMGKTEELRITECPQSPEKRGFRLLSAQGSQPPPPMVHALASLSSTLPTQAPLHRGSGDSLLKEHSWLGPTFSSWRSKSEGSCPVLLPVIELGITQLVAQNIFDDISSINQLKEPNQ